MNQATQYKVIDIAIVTMVWLLAILIVQPLGDFPLNDDWAYATDVKNLLQTGSFAPVGWTSMSLLTHVLWGALCCSIFGFSFEILRFSSLFIGLICLCNVYLIIRELGASRFLALLVALTLGFNPIYFALSFTFMTEISFMAFVSYAALFFIRHLRSESLPNLLLATLFCIIATLSRQTGLFLPLAFIFAFAWKKYTTLYKIPNPNTLTSPLSLLTSPLSFLLPFAALKCFEYYMFSVGKTQALYGLQVDELKYLLLNIPEILPLRVVKNTYQASLYLGLMGLPVWGFLSYQKVTNHHKSGGFKPAAFAMVFPILFLFGIIINDSQMPTLIGILEASGIGPRTLYDTYTLQIPTDNLPQYFWQIVTYASAIGAGLLWSLMLTPIYFLFFGNEKTEKTKGQIFSNQFSPSAVLFLMSAAIYFAPFALVGFYDRYLLPLMMVVLLGVVALYTSLRRTNDFSRCRDSTPQPPPKGDKHANSSSQNEEFLPKKESPHSFPPLEKKLHSFPPLEKSPHSSPPLEKSPRSSPPLEKSPRSSPPLEKSPRSSPPLEKSPRSSPPLEGAGGRKNTNTNSQNFFFFIKIVREPKKTTAILALVLMVIFSIASTHDYLTWNRTRWQAIDNLIKNENILNTQIDGGFEFGGWYNFHEIEIETDAEKSWWWVKDAKYILTFNELSGYDIHAKYIYDSWLQGEQAIFVLKEICR